MACKACVLKKVEEIKSAVADLAYADSHAEEVQYSKQKYNALADKAKDDVLLIINEKCPECLIESFGNCTLNRR